MSGPPDAPAGGGGGTGTTPSPEERRNTPGAIRRMFEGVAPGYDRMNRLLSLGLDQGWRRKALTALAPEPGARILDLCCGTGDLALELQKTTKSSPTPVGCDFTPAMLEIAAQKATARQAPLHPVAGDALRLPFRSGVFGGVVVGFGVRNLPDLDAGFAEIRRVLTPGGRFVILEFSTPTGRIARLGHRAWLRVAVPGLVRATAAGVDPYGYLEDSILAFPEADALADRMRAAGFSEVSFRYLSLGAVALHIGRR